MLQINTSQTSSQSHQQIISLTDCFLLVLIRINCVVFFFYLSPIAQIILML